MKRERVVAFPFARRRGLILRLAGQMVARKPAKADRYVREQLRRQIAALHLRQVSDRAVEKEIGALESALRAELPPSLRCGAFRAGLASDFALYSRCWPRLQAVRPSLSAANLRPNMAITRTVAIDFHQTVFSVSGD
jgi:hypothetical protein